MRAKSVFVLVVSFLAALPYGAEAQKPVNVSFGGGFTQPNAEVSDRLGGGYNFNFGVQINATPVIGIEGLYSFNGFGDKQFSIPIAGNPGGSTVPTDMFGDMSMQYGTASVIVQKPQGSVRPYGLVGMGVYYRKIRLTTPGVGWVPGTAIRGGTSAIPVDGWKRRTSSVTAAPPTSGCRSAAACNFGVAYAELRYHYVWGPEVESKTFTGPAGGTVTLDGRKANGQFLQTTFGVRF